MYVSSFRTWPRPSSHLTSNLSAGGNLAISAGRDLTLSGAQVNIGAAGSLAAGRNVSVTAVVDKVSTDQHDAPGAKAYDKQVHSNDTVVGASIVSNGALAIQAGGGDLTIKGSNIAAGGTLGLAAARDITIGTVAEQHLSDTASHREGGSLVSSHSSTSADYSASTLAIGSSVSGKNVVVSAGRDINVVGSEVTAKDALQLSAARDINIVSATSTSVETTASTPKRAAWWRVLPPSAIKTAPARATAAPAAAASPAAC